MNRRHMLQTGVLSLAVIGGLKRTPVLGQTPEASPEASPVPNYDPYCDGSPGFVVGARSTWVDPTEPDQGVYQYYFSVDIYDSEEHAKQIYASFEAWTDGYLRALAKDNRYFIGERRRLSPPALGDERVADHIFTWSKGGQYGELLILYVRNATALYLVVAWGNTLVTFPTFELVKTALHFDDIDPEDEDSVIALLPSAYDMPFGFSLARASVNGIDEDRDLRGSDETDNVAECVRPLPPVGFIGVDYF